MPSIKYEHPRDIGTLSDCHFYHTMDIPDVGTVNGQWDLRGRFEDYIGHVELRGKSVLDVGTASGFLTFEAERHGANVTSFDISDAKFQHLIPFKDKLYSTDHDLWCKQQSIGIDRWKNAYWMAHQRLKSKARVFYGDIYNLPHDFAPVDISIIGSVLEHLRDQVSALASVARFTKSTLIIVTPVLETEERLAQFLATATNPEADYVWWAYSMGTYREILTMLGFKITSAKKNKFRFELEGKDSERYTIVAERVRATAG